MKMKTWSNNHSYLRSCDLDSQDIQKVKDVLTIVYAEEWNPDEGVGPNEEMDDAVEEECEGMSWMYHFCYTFRGCMDHLAPSTRMFQLIELGVDIVYINQMEYGTWNERQCCTADERFIDNDEGFCDFCCGFDYEWKVGE